MGKKRTELQFLKDSMERKKVELTTVLREAESEVIKKQNELKVMKMKNVLLLARLFGLIVMCPIRICATA